MNTQTYRLYELYKLLHIVRTTESQHFLLFYKSYTQHGTKRARERKLKIHRKRWHFWDFCDC